MCDMCDQDLNDIPVSARPLHKYHYLQLVFVFLHNVAVLFTSFFGDLVDMMRYQTRIEEKHSAAWASISKDLEKLEADNG